MKILSIIGTPTAEPAELTAKIAGELRRRGYTVGCIKIGYSGQDTADTTTASTQTRACATALSFEKPLPIDRLLDLFREAYVLIEGKSTANCPAVICGADQQELEAIYNDRVIAVFGLASSEGNAFKDADMIHTESRLGDLVDLIIEKTPDRMPNYAADCCSKCGGDCRDLLARMLRGEAARDACVLEKASARLTVAGNELPMLPFIQEMLKNIVVGFGRALKGFGESGEIEIRIKR